MASMRAESLHFDAESHTYRLAGRVLPSVTQALRFLENFENVPQRLLEAAAEFGRHVHEACHLHNMGRLDWSALDPALHPYVSAYDKFLIETGFVVTASEERVVNARYGFAGTLDVRGRYKRRPGLVDIKSTAALPATVGPQTAAYEKCCEGSHRRYALLLRPDGEFRFKPLTDLRDWPLFLSCLNLHNYKGSHHAP